MSPSPARSAWRGPGLSGGPAVRGAERHVRGSGPGAVDVESDLVDEDAVKRGLLHQSQYHRLPFAGLTLAERCEVARRICARHADYSDAAAWIGTSAHILHSYHHWATTGEWIAPNRITAVMRERRAQESAIAPIG